MNQNWARWIRASIDKHFDAAKGALHLFIEGYPRETSDKDQYLELRLDGPNFTELSRGVWEVEILINVLVSCIQDGKDAHRLDSAIGVASAAFSNTIGLFRYGTKSEDDGSSFSCLVRLDEALVVRRFGLVDTVKKLEQASVEAAYSANIVVQQ